MVVQSTEVVERCHMFLLVIRKREVILRNEFPKTQIEKEKNLRTTKDLPCSVLL